MGKQAILFSKIGSKFCRGKGYIMKVLIFSGPPSSGKTSVIFKMLERYLKTGIKIGVVKFDCLQSNDDKLYSQLNIPVLLGLSGQQCPDHYFVSNIEDVYNWGMEYKLDILVSESAGLCNRCSPYIKNVAAICVIDQMSGIHTPVKIGPLLRYADMVVITKSDLVSQAEKEVFEMNVQYANPKANIFHVNGLTGQGLDDLMDEIGSYPGNSQIVNNKLRYTMPMALCSYCMGEKNIGVSYQQGNVKKINIKKVITCDN